MKILFQTNKANVIFAYSAIQHHPKWFFKEIIDYCSNKLFTKDIIENNFFGVTFASFLFGCIIIIK